MELLSVSGRLLLAAVFALAGLMKVRDNAMSRTTLKAFGLPPWLAGSAARVLPIAELTTAVLLLPARTVWWGAMAALLLLVTFLVAIVLNLARGRAPACNCFGQVHARPIGWTTVARNSALATIAVVVIASPQPYPALSEFLLRPHRATLGLVAIVAAFGLQTLLIFELVRQHGRLLLRLDAMEQNMAAREPFPTRPRSQSDSLAVGASAQSFAVRTSTNAVVELATLWQRGETVMLVFSDPACGACGAVLSNVRTWQREFASQVTIAVLTHGSPTGNSVESLRDLQHLLFHETNSVAGAYGVYSTPAAVIIRPDGTIGAAAAFGEAAINALLASHTATTRPPAHQLANTIAI